MMFTPVVLGLVLLGQASAAFAVPFLVLQGWTAASADQG